MLKNVFPLSTLLKFGGFPFAGGKDKKQNHMIPEMSLTLFFLRNFIATGLEMMEMRRPSYCKNNLTTEILKPKNISNV